MDLSAYNINHKGVLVYAGLPTDDPEGSITFENHQGEPYKVGPCSMRVDRHLEVWGVAEFGLRHGYPHLREFSPKI